PDYFSGPHSTHVVREILIRHGVYRGNEVFEKQKRDSRERRALIIVAEKERQRQQRHQTATCLWHRRKGVGVETTCKENRWSVKSIWNYLAKSASYKRFVARQKRIWPDKRKYGNSYIRTFPKESIFHTHITGLLNEARLGFVKECRLTPHSRTRIDFKLEDGTFIECKVG